MKKLSLVLLALVLALSGCSAGDLGIEEAPYDNSQSIEDLDYDSVEYDQYEDTAYTEEDTTYVEEESTSQPGPSGQDRPSPGPNRLLITTHTISASTESYDQVVDQISSLVGDYGGYILNSEENSSTSRYIYISAKIPSDKADEFVDLVKNIEDLNISSASKDGTDITDSYYDTQTRLESLKSKLDRLETLRNEQGSIDDLLRVESEINQTIMEIEDIEARLNRYDQDLSFTEISISIHETILFEDSERPTRPSFASRLSSAASASWTRSIDLIQSLIIFVILALPRLLILGLVVYGIYRLVKYLRRDKDKGSQVFRRRKNKKDPDDESDPSDNK